MQKIFLHLEAFFLHTAKPVLMKAWPLSIALTLSIWALLSFVVKTLEALAGAL